MFCFENVFIGIEFWLNVLEGIIDGSASIFFVLFLKPWILSEDLELTFPILLILSYPLTLLFLCT